MTRAPAVCFAALLLVACQPGDRRNPAEEPAAPITGPGTAAPVPAPSLAPAKGAESFVGRWAADVAWCAAPQGDRRPITITPLRFEGYENSCDIGEVAELVDGYSATMSCQSEGVTSVRQVTMKADQDTLRLTWADQPDSSVLLKKCTTLGETSDTPAALPIPAG